VLQSAAMIPFLPRICRGLLDEELKLPSVETWWCGDPVAREHVLGNLAEMVLKPAHPTGASQPIFGEALGPTARDDVKARVRAAPALWSRRRACRCRRRRSSTRVRCGRGSWCCAASWPRASTARARAAGAAGGVAGREYDVMPGALSLVGAARPSARSRCSAERAAATPGSLSGGPVSTFTLLPRASHPVELSRGGGDLPSRVADNLFWLGRYSERGDASRAWRAR